MSVKIVTFLVFTDVHEGVDFRFGPADYTSDSKGSMMETCEVVTRGRKLTKEDFRVARRAEGFEPTFSTPQIDTLTIKLCSRSIFIFFFFP